MATVIWQGGADAVTQTATWTISSNTNTHTFIASATHPSGTDTATTVTILTVTADGALTTTQLAAAIVTAWTASKHEFATAVTASSDSNVVTFTANKAGIPFIITKSGTGTSTLAAVTANAGPNDYNTPSNWVAGAIPVANDTAIITNHPTERRGYDILYGLAQSTVALDEFRVTNFSGVIGSHSTPLHFDVDDRFIFNSSGAVGYFKLVASGAIAITSIVSTGNRGNYGCYFEGGTSSELTLVNITGGAAHFGYLAMGLISVIAVKNNGGKFRSDVASVTLNHANGESYVFWPIAAGTITLISVDDGYVTIDTRCTITTVTQNGGHIDFVGAGTLTTVNANAGLLDTLGCKESTTLTTLTQRPGAVVRYDTAYITPGTHTRIGPFEYRAAPTQNQSGKGSR
jgi:hypothetical protein